VRHIGGVFTASRPPAALGDAQGVIYCEPAAGTTTCAGRRLLQRPLAGGAAIDLGALPSPLAFAPSLALTEGVPATAQMSVSGFNTDLYIVTPGVAGSLRFVGR
jgi:hypothetical protein